MRPALTTARQPWSSLHGRAPVPAQMLRPYPQKRPNPDVRLIHHIRQSYLRKQRQQPHGRPQPRIHQFNLFSKRPVLINCRNPNLHKCRNRRSCNDNIIIKKVFVESQQRILLIAKRAQVHIHLPEPQLMHDLILLAELGVQKLRPIRFRRHLARTAHLQPRVMLAHVRPILMPQPAPPPRPSPQKTAG